MRCAVFADFTSPTTFTLLSTCVCSNALFSNDTDTCRLAKHLGPDHES